MTKKTDSRAPALIAWHVREAKGGKAFWTRIGAAWAHQNGEGHTLQLDLNPLDCAVRTQPANPRQDGARLARPGICSAYLLV